MLYVDIFLNQDSLSQYNLVIWPFVHYIELLNFTAIFMIIFYFPLSIGLLITISQGRLTRFFLYFPNMNHWTGQIRSNNNTYLVCTHWSKIIPHPRKFHEGARFRICISFTPPKRCKSSSNLLHFQRDLMAVFWSVLYSRILLIWDLRGFRNIPPIL